jgi:hypothetical protein
MRRLYLVVGILIAMWCSMSASAALFEYKYTFGNGNVVSGSFTGTANGQYIVGVSNVKASMNGNPFNGSGNLYAINYGVNAIWDNTVPATVSFDGNLNNFMFIDSNYPTDLSYTNAFYIVIEADGVNHQAHAESAFGYSEEQTDGNSVYTFDAARWSVTEIVPVMTVAEQIIALVTTVRSLNLPRGMDNSLTSVLQNALRALNTGNANSVCHMLNAFIHEAQAQLAKKLSMTAAMTLIASANRIRIAQGCQ